MHPNASVSTSGEPSQGSGGGAVRGFKGKKFQPIGGKARMQLARAPKVVNEDGRY